MLALLALAPACALAQGTPYVETPPTSVMLTGVFAYNIETFSLGFRLHPRVALRAWRGARPEPADGTLELGLFGGWSHISAGYYESAMIYGDGTLEGTGAHHGLLLASAGHTINAHTKHGHTVQLGVHLLGGWVFRSEQARITYERYGVDHRYEETAHGVVAGFVTALTILFRGRAGPALEASYFPLATHRGLAHWHVGLGVAIRFGPPAQRQP